MPRPMPPALVELADRQNGVVSRRQLASVGVDRWAIRNQVQAHRWAIVGTRVVVLTRGSLTRRQQCWVAVLHAGSVSALAGRTAAESAGLRGWTDDLAHVVVPKGGPAIPPLAGVVVHESRRFGPADVARAAGPPRVAAARAVVDAASWNRSPRAALGLLAAGVQQRLVTPEQLRDQVRLAGRIRHAQLMRLTIDDIEGGSQALSELDLVAGCRRRGLPLPERQVVRLHHGRRRYLDALFRDPWGRTVIVEVDGAAHLQVGTWWDDLDRQNELMIGGDLVLRFPAARLRADPDHCYDQIRRALSGRLAA